MDVILVDIPGCHLVPPSHLHSALLPILTPKPRQPLLSVYFRTRSVLILALIISLSPTVSFFNSIGLQIGSTSAVSFFRLKDDLGLSYYCATIVRIRAKEAEDGPLRPFRDLQLDAFPLSRLPLYLDVNTDGHQIPGPSFCSFTH